VGLAKVPRRAANDVARGGQHVAHVVGGAISVAVPLARRALPQHRQTAGAGLRRTGPGSPSIRSLGPQKFLSFDSSRPSVAVDFPPRLPSAILLVVRPAPERSLVGTGKTPNRR
jgi:hypothetical protein